MTVRAHIDVGGVVVHIASWRRSLLIFHLCLKQAGTLAVITRPKTEHTGKFSHSYGCLHVKRLIDFCLHNFRRIGQKRDVDTVRLIARGTIEELIYARQVYKVQLTKQTLGNNIDGQNQPQIFRGVANDPNRKGELFGVENLLKFKDGSFMSSLVSWMNYLLIVSTKGRVTYMC
jgi:hypothetical protein